MGREEDGLSDDPEFVNRDKEEVEVFDVESGTDTADEGSNEVTTVKVKQEDESEDTNSTQK